jgi:hypothetical protein
MRFAKHNNIYKIARITGYSTNILAENNILGISFCDDPINENEENEIEVISLEPTENADKTSNSEILDQVLEGLNGVNKALGTNYRLSKIYYVPSQLARSSQLAARSLQSPARSSESDAEYESILARLSELAAISSELEAARSSESDAEYESILARLSELAARSSELAAARESELAARSSELGAARGSEYELILQISYVLTARVYDLSYSASEPHPEYESLRARVYRLLIIKLIRHYHEGGKFDEL